MEYSNVLALQNWGNLCYLNSALQCLLSIRKFRDLVRKSTQSVETVSSLRDLCDKYEDPSIPLANPTMVKQIFGKYDSFFRNNMQQDTHECLIRIIDIIHESIHESNVKSARTVSSTDDSKVAWDRYIKLFGGSFITEIFAGQIKSTLVCQMCKKERNSYETINNISLPLSEPQSNNVVDIVDCFRIFFAHEQLEDMLTCDYCKRKTSTVKYMKLWIYPKVLVLHLKRYSGSAINNAMVETSENLVFRGGEAAKEVRYKLKCIVNHFGANPNSGHYTCISSFENEWVNIDDSNIYRTAARSKNLFTSPSSYVLIYEQVCAPN
jgi:ubiquitin C-terminal hydrolase